MSTTTSNAPRLISAQVIFRSAFSAIRRGSISAPCLALQKGNNINLPECWKCVLIDGVLTISFTYQTLDYQVDIVLIDRIYNSLLSVNVRDVARYYFLLRFQETIKQTPGCVVSYKSSPIHYSKTISHHPCETPSLMSVPNSKLVLSIPSEMITLHSFSAAFRLSGTINSHNPIRILVGFLLIFILLNAPSAQAVGLGLTASKLQHRDMSRQSAWLSSPFHDPGRDSQNTGLQAQNDADSSDSDPEPLPAYQSQLQNPPLQPMRYPQERPSQLYVQPYAPNLQPAWALQSGPMSPPVSVAYGQPRSVYYPEQVDNQRYFAMPQYYNYYYPNWGYPETQLAPGYEAGGGGLSRRDAAYQWRPQNQARKFKRRRKDDKICPKVCDTCIKISKSTKDSRLSQQESDIEKERADLQKRFADQVKPANQHAQPAKALFGYMDTNGDGVITFNELENYLLLHSIIMPELPESD